MASTSIQLAHPKSDVSSIYIQLRDGKKNIKIPAGISIKTKHWGKDKNILSADRDASVKNTRLKNLKKSVYEIYTTAIEKGLIVDAAFIKEELKPKKQVTSKNNDFWAVWDYYLEDRKNYFKPASLRKVKSFKSHLIKFESYNKAPLEFDNITEHLLNKLQNYFYEQAKLNTQTTAKYIGILKMVLNWAVKEGYTKTQTFRSFHPIQQKDSFKVALSFDDLQKIRDAEIEKKKYLQNVRSLFLLSCSTGLRYSDYVRIKKEHIKKDEEGDHYLQITQEKTGDQVELPLTSEALTIVDNIIDGRVHPITNQRMNEYVKELCKIAGLNESFAVRRYTGKIYTEVNKPKYELISSHTGRRTFATNLLLRNIPAETVMIFTGHKDYKSFAKYINIPKNTQRNIIKMALSEPAQMKIAK